MTEAGELLMSFRLGNAFPAGSQLAQWVATIAVIYNDMAVTTNRLYQLLEAQLPADAHERLYITRLQVSHLREAVRFVCHNDSMCQEVSEFLERLPARAKENLAAIRAAAEPWETSFVNLQLKPIRDQVFHYPDTGVMKRALENLADESTGIEQINGALEYRFRFADDLAANLIAEHVGHDLNSLISHFVDVLTCLLRFSEEVVMVYLQQQDQENDHDTNRP